MSSLIITCLYCDAIAVSHSSRLDRNISACSCRNWSMTCGNFISVFNTILLGISIAPGVGSVALASDGTHCLILFVSLLMLLVVILIGLDDHLIVYTFLSLFITCMTVTLSV